MDEKPYNLIFNKINYHPFILLGPWENKVDMSVSKCQTQACMIYQTLTDTKL